MSPRRNQNLSQGNQPPSEVSQRLQSASTMSWKHLPMAQKDALNTTFPVGTSMREHTRSRRQSTLSTARTSGYLAASVSTTKSKTIATRTRTMNERIIRTRTKVDEKDERVRKTKLTPYEQYTFMDEVHDLFFKLQVKEKQRQKYLTKQEKMDEKIEIEEMMRERLLNESLRAFPDNKHLILTRAESNWLQHTKNVKRWYHEQIREGQVRKRTVCRSMAFIALSMTLIICVQVTQLTFRVFNCTCFL